MSAAGCLPPGGAVRCHRSSMDGHAVASRSDGLGSKSVSAPRDRRDAALRVLAAGETVSGSDERARPPPGAWPMTLSTSKT